jgi:hypothetical protein
MRGKKSQQKLTKVYPIFYESSLGSYYNRQYSSFLFSAQLQQKTQLLVST